MLMHNIDFSKPVSFNIVKAILEKKEFTQLSLSQELKVSLGQVNKIVNYLQKKGFVEKGKTSYMLANPLAVIGEIAKYRDMEKCRIARFSLSVDQKTLLEMLKSNAIFCLDTALKQYCNNVVTNRICAYLSPGNDRLIEKFAAMEGNKTYLYLYSNDLPTEGLLIDNARYTDKVRTVIDLVCDNSAFAASKLFEELWAQKII